MNPNNQQQPDGRNAALDLIKQRIKDLYGDEPEPAAKQPSLVDRFWQNHGDATDQQAAWQQFYAGLSNDEKQELWNEYHSINQQPGTTVAPLGTSTHVNQSAPSNPLYQPESSQYKDTTKPVFSDPPNESLKDTKKNLLKNLKTKPTMMGSKKSKAHHWKPLVFSLMAMAIILLAQYNTLFVALAKQYISPGNTLQSPVIIDPSADIKVGKESRIIIPKINVDVPVVYDLGTVNEDAIQNALEDGVVHYDGTAEPGEAGNNVIVGHSSNNFLNAGKYKFAFVLLDRLEINDTFILHHNQTRYVYKVTTKKVVEPTDFSVIQPTNTPTTTLITCTPPGTSWRRLIIQAEQISPEPTSKQINKTPQAVEIPDSEDAIVPGNSPSLWQRFTDLF